MLSHPDIQAMVANQQLAQRRDEASRQRRHNSDRHNSKDGAASERSDNRRSQR